MKNLKIYGLALVAVFSFYSCSDDDDNIDTTPDVDLNVTAPRADTYVNTTALPQPILDYIVAHYPGQTIVEAEIEDNNNYEVKLSNDVELVFDSEGTFRGVDDDGDDDFGDEDIAVANLPQKIRDFIALHYPTATIEEAERENNGNYEIELSNDVEIIFDSNGDFLGQAVDSSPNDDKDDDDIAIEDLPEVITNYINEHYHNVSIIEAEMEDNGYEIGLSNGMELKFDSDGKFLSAEDHNGDDDEDDDDDDSEDDSD
ncbi:PepSY-like domain-containing protein [Salinimicrobium flavum]|uniref:PepSY-like domain-containing protein n=1 Tax=Salinimicrobium flavum TaxID=1737065 RepID=A0ABW5J134_9FLAO